MVDLGESQATNALPRILAVDDDPAVLELLEDVLAEDYEVMGTADPRAALALLDEDDFDLLLVDLGMPEMDGAEVVKRVRARPRFCRLPIILLSAYSQLRDRVAGLDVQGVVRKPFRLDALLKSIQDALASQQKTATKS